MALSDEDRRQIAQAVAAGTAAGAEAYRPGCGTSLLTLIVVFVLLPMSCPFPPLLLISVPALLLLLWLTRKGH